MNNFFIDKIAKLKETPNDPSEDPLAELGRFLAKQVIPASGFSFQELNEEEVIKLMKALKGKKSSGPDWICGYSFKLASKELIPELTSLVNITLRTGKFTQAGNTARFSLHSRTKGPSLKLRITAHLLTYQKFPNWQRRLFMCKSMVTSTSMD